MIHRHAAFRIQPVWLNGTTPRHVIPSERSESRNLPKQQVLSCVGSSSHVVDSSTPLRCGRNDIPEGSTVHPHRLYSERSGRQIAAPTYTLGRSTVHSYGLYSLRCLAMNHRRYIACTIYCVVPFTRTGCIRNVAGGRFV